MKKVLSLVIALALVVCFTQLSQAEPEGSGSELMMEEAADMAEEVKGSDTEEMVEEVVEEAVEEVDEAMVEGEEIVDEAITDEVAKDCDCSDGECDCMKEGADSGCDKGSMAEKAEEMEEEMKGSAAEEGNFGNLYKGSGSE